MPNFLDTIPDNAFKAGLFALSLFYALLIGPEICDGDHKEFLQLYHYFRKNVDKYILKLIDDRRKQKRDKKGETPPPEQLFGNGRFLQL